MVRPTRSVALPPPIISPVVPNEVAQRSVSNVASNAQSPSSASSQPPNPPDKDEVIAELRAALKERDDRMTKMEQQLSLLVQKAPRMHKRKRSLRNPGTHARN